MTCDKKHEISVAGTVIISNKSGIEIIKTINFELKDD